LQRLIADCRTGRISTVITRDCDRLSRDSSQLIALLHIFQKEGVRVEFSTPEGERHLAFLMRYLSALTELDKATGESSETA
jgi:DNA invertase Pin-like site-specific DNA recombinase